MDLRKEIEKKIKEEKITINSWAIKNGLSPQKVHNWLRGEKPVLGAAKKLADALGMSLDELAKRLDE